MGVCYVIFKVMKQLKINLPPDIKEFFVQTGRKGGSSTSEKKINAVRKNGCAPCKPGKFRGRPPKNQKQPE